MDAHDDADPHEGDDDTGQPVAMWLLDWTDPPGLDAPALLDLSHVAAVAGLLASRSGRWAQVVSGLSEGQAVSLAHAPVWSEHHLDTVAGEDDSHDCGWSTYGVWARYAGEPVTGAGAPWAGTGPPRL